MRRGPRKTRGPVVPDKDEVRVNHRIRVPRVLVIDEEGNRLGEFMTEDAVRLAEERGLDLVEVSPNSRPPVCRVTDYGRLKYDKKKKDAVARKNQVKVELKEVKLRPKTDDHDMRVKVGHVRRFLEEGNKVKITLRFRGREFAHRDIGVEKSLEVAKACEDISAVESAPKMEGRQMFMILVPTKKPIKRERSPIEDEPLNEPDDDDDDYEEDADLDDEDDGSEEAEAEA